MDPNERRESSVLSSKHDDVPASADGTSDDERDAIQQDVKERDETPQRVSVYMCAVQREEPGNPSLR